MSDTPSVFGVLNLTPDSFYDGGKLDSVGSAIAHGKAMLAQGATILDLGGESTRPGATPVTIEQELERVMPVLTRLLDETDAILSVDTRHPEVMQAAIEAGAHLINDVCALQAPGALEVVASSQARVCLMHMQGEPQTMQDNPTYSEAGVVADVLAFLEQRVAASEQAGIARERIIIDPGFGFGKSLGDNLALLKNIKAFVDTGLPVLVGVSRKSMFQQLLNLPVSERMTASITAALWAIQQGAQLVRTHDVKETVEAIRVQQALVH